jgi:hypothetical protein
MSPTFHCTGSSISFDGHTARRWSHRVLPMSVPSRYGHIWFPFNDLNSFKQIICNLFTNSETCLNFSVLELCSCFL